MKQMFIACALACLLGTSGVLAQTTDSYEYETEVSGRIETQTQTEASGTQSKGNVEFEWKVEEGEKAQEGDPDRPVIQGNVSNSNSAESQQYNETDIEFISRLVNPIAPNAVEVRGWDPTKKQEFLQTVKTHAEVQSEQDLQSFATGMLLQDENVQSVRVQAESTEVAYRMPAKLFGFLPGTLVAKATVETMAGEEIQSDKYGRIQVRFPWYRFFYRVHQEAQASSLQAHLASELEAVSQRLDLQTDIGIKTETLATVVASLKAKYAIALGQ